MRAERGETCIKWTAETRKEAGKRDLTIQIMSMECERGCVLYVTRDIEYSKGFVINGTDDVLRSSPARVQESIID